MAADLDWTIYIIKPFLYPLAQIVLLMVGDYPNKESVWYNLSVPLALSLPFVSRGMCGVGRYVL
jgi:hypothetical protein